MSTLQTTNLKNPSSGSNNIVLDSSGRVLVGTSIAFDTATATTNYQFGIEQNTTFATMALRTNAAGASGTFISLGKSRGTTANSKTVVQSGDGLGAIFFEGADGTNMAPAASIRAQVDGTPGTNDMPGRLVFSTTADGAASPTERMRISSSGAVTCTGTISDVAGDLRSIPQIAQTSAYTLAATDNGKHISITTGGVTVPSAIFSVGQVVTIFNNSASNQTITQGASVTLRQAGTANTGNRTLVQYGVATILCVASDTFVITGSGLT